MWKKFYGAGLVTRFVYQVFPVVKRELNYWYAYAQGYAEKELRLQATASIKHKRFHCLGGSIYSLYPGADRQTLVRVITALQTISDYLDNLCDRAGIADEQAFAELHLAMQDAMDPNSRLRNYYRFYPYTQDGDYLISLVLTCRQEVVKLPAYSLVKPYILKLVSWYSELQTYKHLAPVIREEKMKNWLSRHLSFYPELLPYEFAAATGSTLGIFMLLAAASNPRLTPKEAEQIFTVYFPWVCGLHILLDYFIDREEDIAGGDLNFTFYYRDAAEMQSRLQLFVNQALKSSQNLSHPSFMQTVIYGLLAMYLSDPKALVPGNKPITAALLKHAGLYTKLLHTLCKWLRRHGIL